MFSKDSQSSDEVPFDFDFFVQESSLLFVDFVGIMNVLSVSPDYNLQNGNIPVIDKLLGEMFMDQYVNIYDIKDDLLEAVSTGIALNSQIFAIGDLNMAVDALSLFMSYLNSITKFSAEEFRQLVFSALSYSIVDHLIEDGPFANAKDDPRVKNTVGKIHKFLNQIADVRMCDVGYMNN